MWYCIIRLVYLLIWKEVWFITDQLSLEDQNELSSWWVHKLNEHVCYENEVVDQINYQTPNHVEIQLTKL